MRVIGIDPGMTGAIATFEHGRLVGVWDMPVLAGRVDGGALYSQYIGGDEAVIYMENTQPMPRNGNIASFKLGLNTGIAIGAIESLQHPLVRVPPGVWKRAAGLIGKPKDAARGLCIELYPLMAEQFRLVKHHGRADATLIGRYGVWQEIHNQTGEHDERSDAAARS